MSLLSSDPAQAETAPSQTIRLATFNVSLYGEQAGELQQRLADGKDPQAEKIAAIIQTVRPDILLLNEIDHDADGDPAYKPDAQASDPAATVKLFVEKFLSVSQDDLPPIEYPHVYSAPSNTGVPSGLDIDGDGDHQGLQDAYGFGRYPGQYAMAVLSRYPIDRAAIRTFQTFRWKDLPLALRPVHPETEEPYHGDAVWQQLRLSSKNHIDVPIDVHGQQIHVLASHPTPPVFDGPEDHNGCRNHDEIRFWSEYIGEAEAKFLVDDQGRRGGLGKDQLFFIAGDLNSDPNDGNSIKSAIMELLSHPRLIDPKPVRTGLRENPVIDAQGDPRHHTADFGRIGGMRVDYVLPSAELAIQHAEVFWPAAGDPDHELISASDHRLVWVDLKCAQQ